MATSEETWQENKSLEARQVHMLDTGLFHNNYVAIHVIKKYQSENFDIHVHVHNL